MIVLTALTWMLRTVLDDINGLEGLSDAGIAMISALFLFLLPSGDKERKGSLLEWKDAQENVPWGLLVLFGGGLSLANAVQSTGLAVWMGNLIPQGISIVLIVILVVNVIVIMIVIIVVDVIVIVTVTVTATVIVVV